MRLIISVLTVLICVAHLSAQPPKYQFSAWPPIGGSINWSRGGQVQTIYTPKNFPGMPAGPVKSVYFRALLSAGHRISTATYSRMVAKIGTTSDTAWALGNGYDTFKTELVTLIDGPFTIYNTNYNTDTNGQWVKIPCDGKFYYSGTSPFVFHLGRVHTTAEYGIGIACTRQNFNRKMLFGGFDSIRTGTATHFLMMDLGIDIGTVGVEALDNIASVGVFPSPATGGTVNISLQAKAAVTRLSTRLFNLSGQSVRITEFANPGQDIFRQLDISGIPPGLYTLELNADGEILNRKLVIQ